MRLLLDTHIFLWYISRDKRLPRIYLNAIRNLNNDVNLSVVSLWEVIVKYKLGKLTLPQTPEIYIPIQRDHHNINTLSLDEASVAHLSNLPDYHRDPFDRMLICQALEHHLEFMTMDEVILEYPVASFRP